MINTKFRVWDKKSKKMFHLSEGKERGIDYQVSFWLGGWELVEITAERGGVVICGKDDTITGTRDDGEIMQYTGLKDKNGKEICGGDIVKTYWQHDGVTCYDYELQGVIIYNQESMCFSLDCSDQTITLIANYEREELHDIEVIGNIYENKEIL